MNESSRAIDRTNPRVVQILDAASRCFGKKGFAGTTVQEIADEAGLTKSMIHYYFENKQALVTELCHSDFESLARHFLKAASIADPVERVCRVGEAYLEFAAAYPNHYRFMFLTPLPEVHHTEEFLAATRDNPEKDAYAFFRRVCAEAIATGKLRPELTDADEMAQILWGSMHGLISIHIMKSDHWVPLRDLLSTARRAMDILFRGMLRQPEA